MTTPVGADVRPSADMRITFVIPEIGSGGAEHALVILAHRWSAAGRPITILTYDDGTSPPFYELDSSIRHLPMNLAGDSPGVLAAVRNNLKRAGVLRREIRRSRPDLVVSFIDQTNVLTLVATRGVGVPVVVVEQSDPRSFPIKRIWERLRLLTYSRARSIVLLSGRDIQYFPKRLHRRVAVIPNAFVLPEPEAELARPRLEQSTLIAVGRLHRDKGFDILLEAFSLIRNGHPEWNLKILGEGAERGTLERQRAELGLEECVFLPGRVKDPYAHMRLASLFVLPSRAEGFPLALCEALACGLPAVCTDCAGGVHDIIENGINGVIVPAGDPPALANALSRLMADEPERLRLARRAPDVMQRFNPEKTFEVWESLLGEVVNHR